MKTNKKIDKIEYDNPMKIHLMEELRLGEMPSIEEQIEFNISKKDIHNVGNLKKGNGRFESGIETYQFSYTKKGEHIIHRIS